MQKPFSSIFDILIVCSKNEIVLYISEIHSGLLEGKMNILRNRKHEKNNENEGSTSTEMIEGNNDNQIYPKDISHEKFLLSIQRTGRHICTEIPVTLIYAFTTANCAIKVRMYLPDEDGAKKLESIMEKFLDHLVFGLQSMV